MVESWVKCHLLSPASREAYLALRVPIGEGKAKVSVLQLLVKQASPAKKARDTGPQMTKEEAMCLEDVAMTDPYLEYEPEDGEETSG